MKKKPRIVVRGLYGKEKRAEDRGFGSRVDSFYTGLAEFFAVFVGARQDTHYSDVRDAQDLARALKNSGVPDVRVRRCKV